MKLIELLTTLRNNYSALKNSNHYVRVLLPSFLLFLLVAMSVLCFGQYIEIGGYVPLDTLLKRSQCVLVLFLIWVMKLLLLDLAHPFFAWRLDEKIKQKCLRLDERLNDAWRLLQATHFTDHGKKERLSSLPWILMIAPLHGGATTLLSKAPIKYLLQKKSKETAKPQGNEAVFWATKQTIFVETQGDDLEFSLLHDGNRQERARLDATFKYFLYWLKQNRPTQSLSATILVLPYKLFTLSEKTRRHVVKRLIERLSVLAILKKRIPVYIVITQCDRMLGFTSFFHGLPQEESEQLFGMQLAKHDDHDMMIHDVKQQYERLIKQINQQLIYKLHHEQNIELKPFIKEFPLQLEHLKRAMLDFIKRLQPVFSTVSLEGIFLTSATQDVVKHEYAVEAGASTQTALTLYRNHEERERTYFVKSLFTQLPQQLQKATSLATSAWHEKIRLQYVLPLIVLIISVSIFSQDFMRGLVIERSIKESLGNQSQQENIYLSLSKWQNIFSNLENLKNIEVLHGQQVQQRYFAFYTKRALTHVNQVYLKAIDHDLLPSVHHLLETALSQFTNYEIHTAYALLKAYLMLSSTIKPDRDYIYHVLLSLEPFHSRPELSKRLSAHLSEVQLNHMHFPLDVNLVQTVRQYFWALSKERLAYIILFNHNNYSLPISLPWKNTNIDLLVAEHHFYVPRLFSATHLTTILTTDVMQAVKESLAGNIVLGLQQEKNTQDQDSLLISNVRNIYIQAYANYWERLVSRVTLKPTQDLMDWEKNIVHFLKRDSMFYQFLQLIHDNTYFEPIISISPRLKALDVLLDKNQPTSLQLSAIQKSLENVQHYVQPVLLSDDQAKAAFELTARRMQNQQDPLTQLRIVADKCPEPIKTWLQQVANQLWTHLMKEAGQYIDVAWQSKISQFFTAHFLNRYPFDARAQEEVTLSQFKSFFGTKGHLVQFYQQYLDPFIDYEDKTWRWKKVDGMHLAFSDEALTQVQLGLRVHDVFFSSGGDDIAVQFSLAARQWGPDIKQVVINMNNQKLIDNASKKEKHLLEWSSKLTNTHSSIQFTLLNQKSITRHYFGEWSLFRLIDDTFDTVLSKNELLLDLSPEDYPVKYVIATKEPVSPFSTIKLAHFKLPEKLANI